MNKTSYRKGNINWDDGISLSNLKCLVGIHNGWWPDIYVDTAKRFLYCPNCHKEKAAS